MKEARGMHSSVHFFLGERGVPATSKEVPVLEVSGFDQTRSIGWCFSRRALELNVTATLCTTSLAACQ
jgi:hypothetical protein